MEVEQGQGLQVMDTDYNSVVNLDSNRECLDFLKLVENPSWRDILLGLVNSEKLDPWDIDICSLTSKYLEVLRSMKDFDLHIPANLILAAAILVRIKSEAIHFNEDAAYITDDIPPELSFDSKFIDMETVSELTYRAKLPRTRKVTLSELLDAVEDAMRTEVRRTQAPLRTPLVKDLQFYEEIEKIDVEKIIKDVYERITNSIDTYSLTTFSSITSKDITPSEKILSFLALLYLNTY
ncbi:MAG: segregation/condensation protein A, partial [Candidatus Micrarchaeia archaeon]